DATRHLSERRACVPIAGTSKRRSGAGAELVRNGDAGEVENDPLLTCDIRRRRAVLTRCETVGSSSNEHPDDLLPVCAAFTLRFLFSGLRCDRSAWVLVGRGGSMRRFVTLAILLL